ncbi:hypothetical protein FOZ63_027325, partial [Perkinsus olseni]
TMAANDVPPPPAFPPPGLYENKIFGVTDLQASHLMLCYSAAENKTWVEFPCGPVPLSWKPLESIINSGEELPRDTAVKRQRVHDEPKTAKKRRQPVGDGEDIEAARKQYPGRSGRAAGRTKGRKYIPAVPTLLDVVNDEHDYYTGPPLTSPIDVSTPPPRVSSQPDWLPTSQNSMHDTTPRVVHLHTTGTTREEDPFVGAASVTSEESATLQQRLERIVDSL